MLEFAREVVGLTAGRRRADLDGDRLLNLGVVRLLELIGEAASRIPKDERTRLVADIPWSQIVNMRNRLIHGYDAVDFDIVWEVVVTDLPALIQSLQRVLS